MGLSLLSAGVLFAFLAVTTRSAPQANGTVSFSEHVREKQLVKDLFWDYDPSLRPVLRREDNVTVTLGISAHQIIDVDERNQVIKISVWIRQVWHNPFLTWNKSHYGDIGQINVHPKKVWKPDIFLYTNADDSTDGSLERSKTQVKINSDGKNIWLSPEIISSSCKINVKYFPFDDQHCKLKFGSWTYDGFALDLMPEASFADIKSFVSNGEWDLVEVPCSRNVVKYVCCVEPYPDITFDFHVRRRTLFYLFNLVIPCLVIVGLTALSFYLPPESGERISLVITNLLAMTVFMLLVAEIIPATSDEVSIISVFYSCCIFEVGLCLIGTCVILKCHFANPSIKPMPSWVREIFLHYVGGLLLNRPKPNGSMQDDQKDLELDTGYLLKPDAAENGYDDNDNGKHDHRNSAVWTPRRRFSGRSPRQARNDMPGDLDLVQSSCPVHTSDAVTSALLSKQGVIAKNLDQMARAQSEHEKHEREKGEWMFVAAVLDRLFLMVFLIILVVSACVLYTRIPNHGT